LPLGQISAQNYPPDAQIASATADYHDTLGEAKSEPVGGFGIVDK
jgi:hypothetical protein